MTIGSELRQAREQRGVSLRDLSERTKVRTSTLRAIEADDWQHLPGGVITRGFLKLYAREVGVDPDGIAERYAALVASAESDGTGEGSAPAGQGPARHDRPPGGPSRFARLGVLGALAVLALVAAGYFALRPPAGAPAGSEAGGQAPADVSPAVGEPPAPRSADAPSGPAASPAQPALPPPAEPPPGPGAASAAVLRVDLQATSPCWVSATADGRQVVYRVMDAGERVTIPVTNEAVLRIGIPANLSVSINDRPVRPFARPATPITLRITPANYRELVGQ